MPINPTQLEAVTEEALLEMRKAYLERLLTERPKELFEALGTVVFEEYLRTKTVKNIPHVVK